jgi:Uma2 family endonuclease
MSAQQTPWTTVEDYLRAERAATFRSEYLNGQVFVMAGGTPTHSFLMASLTSELFGLALDRGCRLFVSDCRLQVAPEGLYTYPDLMVVCGDVQYADGEKDMVTNPVLIVEVLSKSTEGYDRGEKFAQYRRIPSLQEYLLVSQDKPRLEKYVRLPDGTWNFSSSDGPDGSLDVASLGCQLRLDRIYRSVAGI